MADPGRKSVPRDKTTVIPPDETAEVRRDKTTIVPPDPGRTTVVPPARSTVVQPRRQVTTCIDPASPKHRDAPPIPVEPRAPTLDFEDRGEIGSGGMSTVRCFFDKALRREAAVKLLDPRLVGGQAERFVAEAQITGQLQHPNIPPIHKLGLDEEGRPYFTMRMVTGRTLEEVIDDAGDERLAPARLTELLKMLVKVCEAVAYAHDRGVVHRDLKPSNVMIGDFGQVYVMDWGIAKLIGPDSVSPCEDRPGSVMGTPSYMPPEQARGEHDAIDPRTDVFALGGTLYEILYGRPPYEGKDRDTVLEMAEAAAVAVPVAGAGGLEVPPALARLAATALARDPDDRYRSVAAMQADLEDFLQGAWRLPERAFTAGETIITEGEAGDTAYVITAGRCEVVTTRDGERRVLRTLGPGEVFGELAVFDDRPRSASVVAITDGTAMVVSRQTLSEGLGLNTWMGAFVTALVDRFREADAALRKSED
jgi:serine/threonine-protein kinase